MISGGMPVNVGWVLAKCLQAADAGWRGGLATRGIQDHRFNRNILLQIAPENESQVKMLLAIKSQMMQNRLRQFYCFEL